MRNSMFTLLASFTLATANYAQTSFQVGSTTVFVDTLTTEMSIPWEIQVRNDNHMWVTERGGRVSRVNLTTGIKTVVLDLTSTVTAMSESGLLGMAFHPDFVNTPEVFLVYTYGTPDANNFFTEKLVKYSWNGTNLVNEVVLIDDILAWPNHNGSRLMFLPDNTLLMSTGECYEDYLAQDMNSLNGKFLRVNIDGTIPSDNPSPTSYIYSAGHRNAQGICILPNGKIVASEHGPSTDDELQVLEAGNNYGWPLIHGFCDQNFENTPCATGDYTEPIYAWTPTIATSDLIYYQNPLIPEWDERLLMVTLNGQRIVAMQLDAGTTTVSDEDQYFSGQFGRLRDIAIGPNNEIFVATNTGSGGHPILRFWPEGLGVKENQDFKLFAYPNPSSEYLQLQLNEDVKNLIVRDIRGKVVLSAVKFQKQEKLDISRLASGSYSIEVECSKGILRSSFVK